MNSKNWTVVVALVALFSGMFVSTASAVTADELMEQIAALQAQLLALNDGGSGGTNPTPPIPTFPDFSSYGNLSFDDGTGHAWWNMDQYSDRATVNVGAYSTRKIISMQSGMTVDKYDPSRFSFNASIQMLDGSAPTGGLDFRRYSSGGENSLSAQVQDTLVGIWDGWDEVNNIPIYREEMQTYFRVDLFADVMLKQVNDNYGDWTAEWYDGNGELYYSRSGDEFRIDGWGRFLGDNPVAVGLSLVESGAAQFGSVVPEPATMAFLAIGAMSVIVRRRRNRQ